MATSGYLVDTYSQAAQPYEFNPSFNSFGEEIKRNGVIDHIFTTGKVNVKRWGILSDSYHGKYPSDHFPVMAEVSL